MNLLKNFMLLCVSSVLALASAELYLRWNPPEPLYMQTRHVVQQTHSEPSSNPALIYLPKANLSKPFRNREFNTRVTINSQHMRDREYSLSKPSGVKRIAVAGDSYVFGWGVEDHEIFTEILEDRFLKNVEVLNFGVSGYFGNQKLERIKTGAVDYQPDIVLFFTEDKPAYCDATYQWHAGKLYWGQLEPSQWKERIRSFLLKNVYLFAAVYPQYARWRNRASPFPPEEAPVLTKEQEEEIEKSTLQNENKEARQILSELKALSLKYGFHPVLVYFPLKPEHASLSPDDIAFLGKLAQEAGIDFADLSKPLKDFQQRSGHSAYFHYDDHWNKHGHEAVARAVKDYLNTSGLLSAEHFIQQTSALAGFEAYDKNST